MDKDEGKALAAGAIGLSAVALIAALTRKAEAAVPPTDEEVRQALVLILSQQVTTLDNIADLELKLEALAAAEGVIMPGVKIIEQVKFDRTLAIGEVVTIYEKCPFNGYVRRVTIHWPDGADALVDVAVGHSNTQFCPKGTGEYLALNDATPTYQFNEEVTQGEEIWVQMRNRDGGWPHSITVSISVEAK